MPLRASQLHPAAGHTVLPVTVALAPDAAVAGGRFVLREPLGLSGSTWRATTGEEEEHFLRFMRVSNLADAQEMLRQLAKIPRIEAGCGAGQYLSTAQAYYCERTTSVVLARPYRGDARPVANIKEARALPPEKIRQLALAAVDVLSCLHDKGYSHGRLEEDRWLINDKTGELYLVNCSSYQLAVSNPGCQAEDTRRLIEFIRWMGVEAGKDSNWLTMPLPDEWVGWFGGWQHGKLPPASAKELRALLLALNDESDTPCLQEHPSLPFRDVRGVGWMLESPVTQELWKNVTGLSLSQHLSAMQPTLHNDSTAFFSDPKTPVFGVTWDEAARFARLATAWFKRRGLLPGTWCLRLPFDHEWLVAAGSPLAPSSAGRKCWNAKFHTHVSGPAACYKANGNPLREANAHRLLDMSGNVAEWCQSKVSSAGGFKPVLGGSWRESDWQKCLDPRPSDVRKHFSSRAKHIGFRLVACPAES